MRRTPQVCSCVLRRQRGGRSRPEAPCRRTCRSRRLRGQRVVAAPTVSCAWSGGPVRQDMIVVMLQITRRCGGAARMVTVTWTGYAWA